MSKRSLQKIEGSNKQGSSSVMAIASSSRSLGDDLEVSILARVPCHKTLLNAMYAKKAWRERLYSPKFRRQFCSLHSTPPLLGCFSNDSTEVRTVPTFPSFTITRDCDSKINGIVGKGDFFLTKVLNLSSESVCWDICDCIDGLLLLMNPAEGRLVVYNPMTGWLSDSFDACEENTVFKDHIGTPEGYPPRLVRSDENPNSFRVIVLATDNGCRARAAVFSSTERKWSVHPWYDVSPFVCLRFTDLGSIGNQSLYWGDIDRKCLLKLDKKSLKFSTIPLPVALQHQELVAASPIRVRYGFGEIEGGKPCIVASLGIFLAVWVCGRDPNGVERWVLRNHVPLADQLRELLPEDVNEEDGDHLVTDFDFHGITQETVFFDALYSGGREEPHWCLSMRLDTMKLQKLFRSTAQGFKYPYFIGWPSSKIDDRVG
jgi:hypothetical protein